VTIVSNPNSAFGYSTLAQTAVPDVVRTVKVTGAVTAGDVVVWTTQNTDVNATVRQADVSADDPALIAGVAITAATAANETITICRLGPCLVNIGDATVAAGDRAAFHATTDGAADGAAADATTISGDTFGVFLGAEIGSTNQAVVDVHLG
jgi:hypothetical protein